MKQLFKELILWTAIGAMAFFAYTNFIERKPCVSPIEYRLGAWDERFGVSQAEVLGALEKASAIWEKPLGKDLFKYDAKGKLAVNFVYDERQQLTQRNQSLESGINQTKLSADAAKQKYTALNQEYEQNLLDYNNLLRQFEQAQQSYNVVVASWNKKCGAPKGVYDQLAAQASNLEAQQNVLEQKRQDLISLANEINALISQYNLLVSKVNANVKVINQTAGREFEEGVYIFDTSGTRINIYEFSDEAKLVRVLAHELGHALGLEHNLNPDSIMYELNQSQNISLTAEDLGSLKDKCNIK